MARSQQGQAHAHAQTQPTVLVVDDDEQIRESLRLVLEDAGYQVQEAADGLQAVSLLQAAPQPLVVLLDLVLPDSASDHMSVLAAVKVEPVLARHRYVAVTALDASRFTPPLRDLLAATCLAVVAKPFDIDDIVSVVRQAEQHLSGR